MIFALPIALAVSYIIGSFPTSFILTRLITGSDIRRSGSGNAGATNVLRVVGKLPALATLLIDIFKGIFVVTVIARFFYPPQTGLDYGFYRALIGLSAVCGHIWPVFLKFRGGKGVATTLGVAAVIAPKILLITIAIWAIVFSITKYVSLASIIALILFPMIAVYANMPLPIVLISVIICGIVISKHKPNMRRLLRGAEMKISIFGNKR